MNKYIGNIIALAVVAGLIFGAIHFKKTDFYQSFKEKTTIPIEKVKEGVEVFKHNLEVERDSERQRPFNTVEIESKLRGSSSKVFGPFERGDWNEFWNIIFTPIGEKQGSYIVKRYRTKEEVEKYCRDNFENFDELGSGDWEYLWGVVFSNR